MNYHTLQIHIYVNSGGNVETSMKEQELYVQDIVELANSLN